MTTTEQKLKNFESVMAGSINGWMTGYYEALPWTVEQLKERNIELTEDTDTNLLALDLIEGQDYFDHDDIEVTLNGFMTLAFGDSSDIYSQFGLFDPDETGRFMPGEVPAFDMTPAELVALFKGDPMLAAEELVKAQDSYVSYAS